MSMRLSACPMSVLTFATTTGNAPTVPVSTPVSESTLSVVRSIVISN